MAAKYPILDIPNEIRKIDETTPMFLRENFEEIQRALSKLQVYFNETGIRGGRMNSSLVEIVDEKGNTKFLGDGLRVYDFNGELKCHMGYFETLAAQLAAFTRLSPAYDSYGNLIASGVPRYEYASLSAPVWQDLFDVDQLAAEYTSGGDVAAAWAVSGGVLTGTGGIQATLIKKDLLLQDCEIEINSDQAQNGGIIARYQDNNNYYLLNLEDDSGVSPTHNLEFFKRVGGNYTSLGYANVTWARGTSKPIKFSLYGSTLEVYFDGVKVISITDTTFTGGGVGLRNYGAIDVFRALDFTVYYAQQGSMVEEGTTNLALHSEQFTNAVWVTVGTITVTDNTTVAPNGLTTAATLAGASAATYKYQLITGYNPASKIISCSVWLRADTPCTCNIGMGSAGIGSYYSPNLSVTSVWQKFTFTKTFLVTDTGDLFGFIQVETNTVNAWGAQIENMPYPTSYMQTIATTAIRAAETMTVPTAGVFTKSNWAVKLKFTPTSRQDVIANVLVSIMIDINNLYEIATNASGCFYLAVKSGGVQITITGSTVLQVGSMYNIMASGNGSVMRLCVNGVQIGVDTAYTEPVGALPTNMYLGSGSTGANQANGIISDFATLNQAQTLAQHVADYATGLPLSVTDYTTYLMSMNGNLQPTIRNFGLKVVNGEIDLIAPPTTGGIRVYDALNNLMMMIGQYAPGLYGILVNKGEIYSTSFQSGAQGATNCVRIGKDDSPINVLNGGKTVLSVWSNSDSGGMLQFFESGGDMRGQILPSEPYYGNGLKIQGRTSEGASQNVTLEGATIYIDASQYVNILSRFWNDFLPYANNSGYVGNNTYKWNTVRATFITPGDLCFEETSCPICEQPFIAGDALVLFVKTIHEEHHTMTIPIHKKCKGIPKTLDFEVPETEEKYQLKEDGQLETYRVSKFEEVEEEVHKIKEGYSLDEVTGQFKNNPLVVDIAKEGYFAKKTDLGIKFFEDSTGEEVNLRNILEPVEIFGERPAIKDEAVEVVFIKKRKPVMKTIAVTM